MYSKKAVSKINKAIFRITQWFVKFHH